MRRLPTSQRRLIKGQRLAADEDGEVLVWIGEAGATAQPVRPSLASPRRQPALPRSRLSQPHRVPLTPNAASSPSCSATWWTRRCSPASSTRKSCARWCGPIKTTCAKVIARFEGHIAQYLGDGLLVYFGYPLAHEDDAQRAVRAGLGMVEAMGQLNTRLAQERGVHLAVRLGIHTGLVVVGEVGGGTRHEQLALGETPNLAARLQGLAAPNTLVISAATSQLLGGFFACQSLGTHLAERLRPAAGGLSGAV